MTDSLDYGTAHRVRVARRATMKAIEDCILDVGTEVVLASCGTRRQDLRDALNDREGRRWPIEWTWAIALVAPEHLRATVATALVEPLGFGIAPIRPLTAEERLARLEYRVAARFGPAGSELVEGNRR